MRKAAPLGLRVPFSHEIAVTAGTLSSVANSVGVPPRPRRLARIGCAGLGWTGGGSFTVRSRAGGRPAGAACDAGDERPGIEANFGVPHFASHRLQLVRAGGEAATTGACESRRDVLALLETLPGFLGELRVFLCALQETFDAEVAVERLPAEGVGTDGVSFSG